MQGWDIICRCGHQSPWERFQPAGFGDDEYKCPHCGEHWRRVVYMTDGSAGFPRRPLVKIVVIKEGNPEEHHGIDHQQRRSPASADGGV